MPPNRFESEVGNFLEGSHGDRTHIKRADHHTVTPLCGTLLAIHPNRRGALPTDRVQRPQSQEQTRNRRDDRRHAQGGLKNKTCWFVATFRLVSAEKSVLKLVGANLKDGKNVLVCSDFSACWCRKINIEGGSFIVGV